MGRYEEIRRPIRRFNPIPDLQSLGKLILKQLPRTPESLCEKGLARKILNLA